MTPAELRALADALEAHDALCRTLFFRGRTGGKPTSDSETRELTRLQKVIESAKAQLRGAL